jgi:hypothetical protein
MFLKEDRESGVRATRLVAIPPLRPEFDNFLYASIGEIEDEMPVSVLSAFARQNLDPWEEAATLAQLSRELAIVRLTSMICSDTLDPSEPAITTTATRLVALLPLCDRFNIPFFDKSRSGASRTWAPVVIYAIAGAIIIACALLAN